MEATKEETTYKMGQSEEMSKFYRALAMVQASSILYVMNAKDTEDMKIRATEMTGKLLEIIVIPNMRGSRCGPNEIRNPITGMCEPS